MKKDNNSKANYEKLLAENLYMCVATATASGEPWISQVYFVADDQGNFYWYSSVNTRHSRLIAENKKVALSIFNSTAVGDDVQAVYVKANCTVVTDTKSLISALTLYAKKLLKTGFVAGIKEASRFIARSKDFLGKSELRLYKAVPYEVSMLAESKIFNGKYVDQREVLDLN